MVCVSIHILYIIYYMVPGANVCMLSACILEQDIKLYTFGHDSLIQNNVLLLFFQFERVR